MSTRDRLVKAADRLFGRFVDVTLQAIYRRTTAGSYDTASGTRDDIITEADLSVILETWRQDQINGDTIKAGDRIAKIRASQLGFEPSTDDALTIRNKTGEWERWEICGWSTDPAQIIYDVHVRGLQ